MILGMHCLSELLVMKSIPEEEAKGTAQSDAWRVAAIGCDKSCGDSWPRESLGGPNTLLAFYLY